MERFNDLRELNESKDNIIDKMSQLTDEQKTIAKDFFNKHNAYEREVDWNKWRTLSWEDLEKVIKKDRSMSSKSQVKKSIKKGLEGFTQDLDYGIIAEGELNGSPWVAYQPYTWEASRMIASRSVEPSSVEGEWCTAYQKEDFYWRHHTHEEDYSAFIYLCGESIPYGKVAIEVNDHQSTNCDGLRFSYNLNGIHFNIWDSEDNRMTAKTGAKEVRQIVTEELLRKALENLKGKYARDEELDELRRQEALKTQIEPLREMKVYKAIEDNTLKFIRKKANKVNIYDYNGGGLEFLDVVQYNREVSRVGRLCGWDNMDDFPLVCIDTWHGDLEIHTMDMSYLHKVEGNCIIWNETSFDNLFLDTMTFNEVTGNLLIKNDGVACKGIILSGYNLKVGGRVAFYDFLWDDLLDNMSPQQLIFFLNRFDCNNFPQRERLKKELAEAK